MPGRLPRKPRLGRSLSRPLTASIPNRGRTTARTRRIALNESNRRECPGGPPRASSNSRTRHYHRVNEDRPHELWNNPSPPVTCQIAKTEHQTQIKHEARMLANIRPSEILMNPSSMSRRHWIGAGLATCGYLAAAQCQALADETSLLGYTKPGPVTLRGLAPRLQHRVITTGPHGV